MVIDGKNDYDNIIIFVFCITGRTRDRQNKVDDESKLNTYYENLI